MPEYLKALYKTAYELGPMPVVEMAVDRAPFVCQSQAMTIFMRDPNTTKLVRHTLLDCVEFRRFSDRFSSLLCTTYHGKTG